MGRAPGLLVHEGEPHSPPPVGTFGQYLAFAGNAGDGYGRSRIFKDAESRYLQFRMTRADKLIGLP